MNGRICRGRILIAALLLLTIVSEVTADAPKPGCPILLTFDVELREDVEALKRLDPPGSCTFFVTGEFAEQHPDEVRRWATRHEIGCHTQTHPHLPTLDAGRQAADIRAATETLRKLTGGPIAGFRAPYLEADAATRRALVALGYRYSSSTWDDSDESRSTGDLWELPISTDDSGRLAADYDLFEVAKLSDAAALEFLNALYDDHARTGRPLVLLLHPHQILKHIDVFHRFVDRVGRSSTAWTSFRGWIAAREAARPSRRALWVDAAAYDFEAEQVARDAAEAGFTDLLALAYEPTEGPLFGPSKPRENFFDDLLDEAHRRGLKVHAWLPVLYDPARLRKHPSWAMVDAAGMPSDGWVCPSRADWRAEVVSSIRDLIDHHEVDGIHLDYLRFPSPEACQCADCRAKLAARLGEPWPLGRDIAEDPRAKLAWWAHRQDLIRETTEAIAGAVRERDDRLEISAALKPEGAIGPDGARTFGQSYEQLGPLLDFVAPMAYHQLDREPTAWVKAVQVAGRWRSGRAPIWLGLQAYKEPGGPPYGLVELAEVLRLARTGSEGVALFSYSPLMGRGRDERAAYNLPAGAAAMVGGWSRGSLPGAPPPGIQAASTTQLSRPARPYWIIAGLGIVGLAAAWAASRRPRAEPVELPLAALEALAAEPSLTGAQAAQVTRRLQRILPADLDRLRVDALLRAVEAAGGALGVEAILEADPGGIGLAGATRQGLIAARGDRSELTPSGRARLAADIDPAARRWDDFVEARLREPLRVTCPGCGAVQNGHWLRPNLGCAACHRRFTIERSPSVVPARQPRPDG